MVFLSPFLKFSKILILNRGTIYPKKPWKNLQKDMQTLKPGIFWGTQNKIFSFLKGKGFMENMLCVGSNKTLQGHFAPIGAKTLAERGDNELVFL